MTRGYGQYCPLALATELLCNRWTILVASRVIDGCTTFNEIHKGVPRISPSMLSRRLQELTDAGIIERRESGPKRSVSYHPTEAGKDLDHIIMLLSVWGQRWARDMTNEDLDPAFLAWSMHLRIDVNMMPPGRTVLEFEFTSESGLESFWLVSEDGALEMCLKHPGYESDLIVRSDIRTFIEAWRGFRDLRQEIQNGNIRLDGPRSLQRSFPDWLQLSMFADHDRRIEGVESTLCRVRRARKTSDILIS